MAEGEIDTVCTVYGCHKGIVACQNVCNSARLAPIRYSFSLEESIVPEGLSLPFQLRTEDSALYFVLSSLSIADLSTP